jgi:hypothetical protein
LGFINVLKDGSFNLLVREPDNEEFLNMNIASAGHKRLLGLGWYAPEGNFRWTTKESSILFKINRPQNLKLQFTAASFYKNQPVEIYINKKKVGTVNLTTELNTYSLPVSKEYLQTNINQTYFVFEKAYRPSEVSETNDQRSLAGKFESINLIKVE